MSVGEVKTLYDDLCLTSVFIRVTEKPIFCAFERFVKADETDKRKAYAVFVSEIYKDGGSLTSLVSRLVFEDENPYVKTVAQGGKVPDRKSVV